MEIHIGGPPVFSVQGKTFPAQIRFKLQILCAPPIQESRILTIFLPFFSGDPQYGTIGIAPFELSGMGLLEGLISPRVSRVLPSRARPRARPRVCVRGFARI